MAKKDSRLIIYERTFDLITYTKNLLIKYPKSERFDLCNDIKKYSYSILEKVIRAWKIDNAEQRLGYLTEADIDVAVLKTLVRISYKFKYITENNYIAWNEKLSEIGKMLGGWIKSCQRG
jgi:four helix bundle protein